MGIHVKKENTNAIIIYINTITRDYTVPPPRAVPSRAQLCDIVSKFVSKFALTKIINRLHAITHDWHLPRSCFLPPWQNSGHPLAERFAPCEFCQGYTRWQRACYVY